MGRETLGPVKALCTSVGECQSQEVEVGELMSKGRGEERGTLSLSLSLSLCVGVCVCVCVCVLF